MQLTELSLSHASRPSPLQAAWKKDARSQQEIALAVEIDPDGKAATLDSESLSGYGVSKPIVIGGQVRRALAYLGVPVYYQSRITV